MSAFITGETTITDQELLKAALIEMGFKAEQIECHVEPQHLLGWKKDVRPETAHVIVRAKNVGNVSNDIGFVREHGKFVAIVSQHDSRLANGRWAGHLDTRFGCLGGFVTEVKTRASILGAERAAKLKGMKVTRVAEGRTVRLVCER